MIRVIIADDHAVVRGGVARIIEHAGDLALVGEAASGPETLEIARSTLADVLVLDLDMPGGGLGLLESVAAQHPALRVLVFSQHAERDFALQCLEAGAFGYLAKDSGFQTIEDAIHRVASGRRYLSETAQDLVIDRAAGLDQGQAHLRLSSRELEVVRMLARGMRNADIAATLGVSPKTVSTHRTHALEKLDLANTVELAIYAREHGLV